MDGDLASVDDVKAFLKFATAALTAAIASGDTTLAVTSTGPFPAAGRVSLAGEVIAYTGKTDTTFTGATRGALGTTAAAHASGARLYLASEWDGFLGELVSAASAFWVSETGQAILEETHVREAYDGMGGEVQVLRHRPIAQVVDVRVNDVVIPAATSASASGWTHDATAVYLRGYRFTRGRRNVEITSISGLCDVPADIRQYVTEWAALGYTERERYGVASKTLAGETIAYFDKVVGARARAICANYRNVVPV